MECRAITYKVARMELSQRFEKLRSRSQRFDCWGPSYTGLQFEIIFSCATCGDFFFPVKMCRKARLSTCVNGFCRVSRSCCFFDMALVFLPVKAVSMHLHAPAPFLEKIKKKKSFQNFFYFCLHKKSWPDFFPKWPLSICPYSKISQKKKILYRTGLSLSSS